MRRQLSAALGLVTASIALSGCTGDDADTTTPVPEQAEAPYLCPGVPKAGADLATGGPQWEDPDVTGEWGDRNATFQCRVEGSDAASVSVTQNFGDIDRKSVV